MASFLCLSYSHLCLLLVFILFHSCLSNNNSNNVLCMDIEREALLRFKYGLIDETERLASWVAENTDCCTWAGIGCDHSTGHVHQIHLPGYADHCHLSYNEIESKQKLKGDISSSLLDLKQLKHLDLSCNDFGRIQIPKFIGSLQSLRYLNLSSSVFGGIIPSELGNLSNLRVLCLGNFHHSLSAPPIEATSIINMRWLSNLGMLHHLDMSGVELSQASDWLLVINTLPSLSELHLCDCLLSNPHLYVPRLNLTSLSVLDLSLNDFNSSVPQWVFSTTSLVSLDLSGCFFHNIIPGGIYSFHNLTSLKALHVSRNNFIDSLVLKQLSSTKIISLEISSCGISSSILDSLHNLTNLLYLDVSGNQLTKRLPESLCNICNLREIGLSFNNFSNISLTYLLESFFKCKSSPLESLYTSMNHIVGIIPHSIGQLSFLRTLDLGMNQFSGPIPYSIGQLSSLEEIYLSQNRLDGNLPESIGQLSSLKVLYLSNNRLNGSLPNSLGQLSKLITLDISYNLLTGVVTEFHFVKLVSLKSLLGTRNNLTLRLQDMNWFPPFSIEHLLLNSWVLGPQFPLWLESQKDLKYLDISNASISSPMPESFVRSFPYLRNLVISNNHIQGRLTLSSIHATLVEADLSSNEFSGSLHYLLCSYGVSNISFLNLGNNHFSSFGPEYCWENWSNLAFLNLENNNLSGEIPTTLGCMHHLQVVNMHGNKISGGLPTFLMNLTRLEILELGRNELVGGIPSWIGTKLSMLKLLNLRSNNLTGNIPHELCYLIHVHILDLAHNNLSGNIPRCFNNFSVLSGKETLSDIEFSLDLDDSLVMKGREDIYTTILPLVMLLDVSSNNLVGQIPSELASLGKLNSLNLSRNQLTGRIPENIGDMKALESFDLSLNKLHGTLPMSLSKLTFLSSLNVSYNYFTGRIPVSTQLQSMNESSFFGNKLCGAPLTTKGCVTHSKVLADAILGEQKEDAGRDWGLIISIALGFVTGFWMIVAPLIVNRTSRIAYFHFLGKWIKKGI